MLCFPKSVHSQKNLGRSSSLFPLLHFWVARGAYPGFYSFQELNTGFVLTNLAQLAPRILLSLAPERFWYSSSTHSAQQSACLFRFGSFHGYCLVCY